jgi:UDP-N-acetylmuramoyl-tripeptide--D-alanyl-D-alanine ligase
MTKKLLQIILDCLAKIYIWRYKPRIVAITGNAGKTSTKDAVACVLGAKYKIRKSEGNLNNEMGVPMTIIGDFSRQYYNNGSGGLFWLNVFLIGLVGLINSDYPEFLILEYGADKVGDIENLVRKYKPNIGVVTFIGDIPVHVENFSSRAELVKEKSKLASSLDQDDFVILNSDDESVSAMSKITKANVISYGFNDQSRVKVTDFDYISNQEGEPLGVSFKVYSKSSTFVPVRIMGSLGRSQAYVTAAATGVGLALGMNLVEINNALSFYRGPAGRLKILRGINNSWIIDDTYNSSPASVMLALDTLKSLLAKRRIAILGDMLELGKYTEAAHREISRQLRGIGVVICVGPKSKIISDLVGRADYLDRNYIYEFETSEESRSKIKEIIREGDLVLVKGSQGMRMEKIVEEIMAEPKKKKELLVRQSKRWLSK